MKTVINTFQRIFTHTTNQQKTTTPYPMIFLLSATTAYPSATTTYSIVPLHLHSIVIALLSPLL